MIEEKKGIFSKIKEGLQKTRQNIISGVESVFKGFSKIDDELFDELEESLILADVGAQTSASLTQTLRERAKREKISSPADLRAVLIQEIEKILLSETPFELTSPSVLLVIGVNGAGKTTSIGKLASFYKNCGKRVILAAADTFRAAAAEQLEIWGRRADVPVIRKEQGADPASVVFDAIASAKAKRADILICDTAGRLQNKKNLMEELKKISRIINREFADAHIETLLVLDATTGQNAVSQAKVFKEASAVTGVILTKLDGTAKGGVVISIKNELELPVRFIGIGESVDDLRPFDAKEFAEAIFGEDEN
ncbi:MAG: signal recognition particle-docking protein FtsY [Clostridiales bacterium]|jgi:fused signal recognition particle receptor|nr:signal recognition particle-docking protein FtsY [Clostridiales bacterium]